MMKNLAVLAVALLCGVLAGCGWPNSQKEYVQCLGADGSILRSGVSGMWFKNEHDDGYSEGDYSAYFVPRPGDQCDIHYVSKGAE